MFFNRAVFVVFTLLTGCSIAKSADSFSLSEMSETQYLLETATQPTIKVIADMQGADELELVKVYDLTCSGVNYQVPAVKGNIENAESTAEHIEYFIFKNVGDDLSAIKTIGSIEVKRRSDGIVVNEHTIDPSLGSFNKNLCNSINRSGDMDYPIQFVDAGD
ncbi:hypothetical protein V6248_17715 [Pseudoalteromonas agarivorans]|uniref:hypothetical protein n=1 Tax=Pseudoalteromonas agarivorans TaxID=176102 RepID=UPI00311D6B36